MLDHLAVAYGSNPPNALPVPRLSNLPVNRQNYLYLSITIALCTAMKYSASLDKSTKLLTIGLTVFFIAVLVFEAVTFSAEARVGFFASAVILVVTYLYAYLYHPTGYTLNASELHIHRPIGSLTYARGQFTSVKVVPKENLRYSLRTFGVGGLFGYYGKFYNAAYGHMSWYLTRREHLVMITLENKKNILLSPDEADAFLKNLQTDTPLFS
ncbi:PH domain-containing protein [Dyadobacter sp. CY261]|uniref:PH domain-containing protein n=1 Tax=Dyadobacter sp. CY261 TaxID=2907203 RepID=UPI001F276D96|nr:PH domain-containing protein [Dyadobacter sp. CY261]MCF0071101.1 PH domain-containing protein [Dyadobacter sp. CY261]